MTGVGAGEVCGGDVVVVVRAAAESGELCVVVLLPAAVERGER